MRVEIPADVLGRLESYFKAPAEAVTRKADIFGGKTAVQFVADGDGSWSDVLAKYEAMFSYSATQ